ncbi:MAG: DUF2723 domain-containing protein [Gemmatimonadota bacterium]
MNRPTPRTLGALAAGLGAFALYVITLAPTTAFWDTSEYIATAHIVGIPHPPGNPLFVFVAKVWSMLLAPTGLSVAVRINLFAAATSAGATGFFYLVTHRVLSAYLPSARAALVGSGAAALIGATAFTVWNQSNVNEKVYTLSVLIIAVVSWLAVTWYDHRDEEGSERYLLVAIFMLALGSTSHMMSVLPAPALVALVAVAGLRRLLTVHFLSRAVLLVLVGISFNFVLPIRAGLDPVVNEGDPACEAVGEAAVAVFTGGRSGCEALAAVLTREQYQTPPITARNAPFGAQLGTYLQYFEWQWSRGLDASPLPSGPRIPPTLLFFALGVMGLWTIAKVDRALFAYLFVLAGTLTLALVVYLNFKHGYSLHADLAQAQREVRERDYFFIAGFLYWGVLAGIGLTWFWDMLAQRVGGGARRYGATAAVLLVAFFPMVTNWAWATRSGDHAARDWAYDLLMSVEPYAVLFTNGDNDTFPLWYLQEVEGIREDVTVIVGQYLQTTWYIKQLRDLSAPENQRPYDDSWAPGLHEAGEVPTRSITRLTDEEMDRVGPVRLGQDLTVPFPRLAVTYPEGMVLGRIQQLALRIISDTATDRPVYFSSAGGLMQQLGLDPWGVKHGLTTKLELRNIDEHSEGLTLLDPEYGADWVDLEKSMTLYDDVYLFRGLRDRDIWPDRSTSMMPMQYYVLALQLSNAIEVSGGVPAEVTRLRTDASAFETVALGGPKGTPGRSNP